MCDAGDAVCDYDPDAEEVSATAAAIHTSYTVGGSNGQMWTWMVHQLLGSPSTPAPQVPEVATTVPTRRKKAPVGANLTRKPRQARSVADVVALHQSSADCCGGLVGPIFLAVYFATGQDSLLKWMFYVGLLITAADILIAFALATLARSRPPRRLPSSRAACWRSQITGMGETGTRINDQPVVKLQLHIEGPGIAQFNAQDRVIASVTRLAITSRKLVVLVDPATQEFQIDWERSALINGWCRHVHDRRRQQDLRSQWPDRRAAGDPADPQSQRHRHEQHDRPAVQLQQRQQAVVRRASAAGTRRTRSGAVSWPSTTATATAATCGPAGTVHLTAVAGTLETLRATGAVSEEEYTAKRAQILSDL